MGRAGTDNPRDQASRDSGMVGAQTQSAQTRQVMEMAAARGKQKPDGEDALVEADKENDDDRKQNGHNDDTPVSEHAGSTQNSQPQPIAHINKMQASQGSRMKMTTHQERGGTHLPEAANRASQCAKDPAEPDKGARHLRQNQHRAGPDRSTTGEGHGPCPRVPRHLCAESF